MRKVLYLITLAVVVFLYEPVNAQQLGTYTLTGGWGENQTGLNGVKIIFGWYTGTFPNWTSHPCLEWDFTTANIGSTIYLNSQTSSKFNEIAGILTNNNIDNIYFTTSALPYSPLSNVYPRTESDFTKYGISGNGFYGCTINSISLRLDAMQITSPGRNPNNDGKWTDFFFSSQMSINGVPEPSTLLLLGFGGLFFKRRK